MYYIAAISRESNEKTFQAIPSFSTDELLAMRPVNFAMLAAQNPRAREIRAVLATIVPDFDIKKLTEIVDVQVHKILQNQLMLGIHWHHFNFHGHEPKLKSE